MSVKKNDCYFTTINPNITLITNSGELYACSFLKAEINDDTVNKLYCMIHPKIIGIDFRPDECRLQNHNTCELSQLSIEEFIINGRRYMINQDLRQIIEEPEITLKSTCKT